MSWKERIQPASFKGAPFAVSGDEHEDGRRTVVHEFPQRDEVYVEDLGAATGRFTIQAFVIGQDYMNKRDALESVLNEPGPGTLVHPWYGEITVSQGAPYKVKHSAEDGGMAVFTLSFVRDAAPASPAAGVNQGQRALAKAAAAGTEACSSLNAALASVVAGADLVNLVSQTISGLYARAQTIVGGATENRSQEAPDARPLEPDAWLQSSGSWPESFGEQLLGAFAALSGDRERKTEDGKTCLSSILRLPFSVSWPLASAWLQVAVMDMPAAPAAIAAISAFVRHIAITFAASALAVLVPASRAEARKLREDFVDAVDAVLQVPDDRGQILPSSVLRPLPSDALYAALADLRAATLAALAEAARSAPDVISYTPAAILPSLVLCHSLTGGIALDADLVTRNRVTHPGFVPARELEALRYE